MNEPDPVQAWLEAQAQEYGEAMPKQAAICALAAAGGALRDHAHVTSVSVCGKSCPEVVAFDAARAALGELIG